MKEILKAERFLNGQTLKIDFFLLTAELKISFKRFMFINTAE